MQVFSLGQSIMQTTYIACFCRKNPNIEPISGHNKKLFTRHSISSFPVDDSGFQTRNRNEYVQLDHAIYGKYTNNPYLEQTRPYGIAEEVRNHVPRSITLELTAQNEDSFIISKTNSLRNYIKKGFQVVCKVIVTEGPKELIIAAVQIFDKIKVFWADVAQPLGGISVNKAHLSQTFTPLVDTMVKKPQLKNKLTPEPRLHSRQETPPIEQKPSRFMTIYKKKEPEPVYPVNLTSRFPVTGNNFEPMAIKEPPSLHPPKPPTTTHTGEKTVSRWKTLNKTPNKS